MKWAWQLQTKHTTKRYDVLHVGIYGTQIWPGDHDILALSGRWLDITGYTVRTVDSFWLANWEIVMGEYQSKVLRVQREKNKRADILPVPTMVPSKLD